MASLTVKQLKPAPGYMIVEPAQKQSQTSSGIFLPDSHEEKPQYGTVIAVGDTVTTESGAVIKTTIKKGDTVVYKKWGGNEVKIADTEYQFLKFDDILASVNEK